MERLLHEEIHRREGGLFNAEDKLAALNTQPLSEAEIEVEIRADRKASAA
jgi:hypothetical protein